MTPSPALIAPSPPPRLLAAPKLPRSRLVLVLVDFINPLDFPGGEKLAAPAVAAAQATAELKAKLTRRGVPTIYANDNYGTWQSDFHSLVSSCLGMEGPAGEIARLLYPQASDLTVLKPRHSAFYGSPLELLLAEIEARELVICGLATDICVQFTAMDAFLREFRIRVPADCTAAESPQAWKTSLAYMEEILRCDVRPATAPRRARKA